jgi:hypothetical protein
MNGSAAEPFSKSHVQPRQPAKERLPLADRGAEDPEEAGQHREQHPHRGRNESGRSWGAGYNKKPRYIQESIGVTSPGMPGMRERSAGGQ